MIDSLTSLSFAVYSNKGGYALLLGSGVSRSSGIPTGWEVVLDLIRKVAALEGCDCEPDPAEWFREKNKTEPDYSRLLDGIAKTATERQQLLRGYFEPTDDEREQGLKLPSAAHRAIARLVVSGHIRVILTTNFDRLTEKALEDIGISPTVISTADQIAGSMPLVHSRVTIIKLHGDYLDTRILNTESELTSYDKALDGLLDRVLDEYGLILSGWSGDWDIALRSAIERCPTRRFTTFWATRSPLSMKADNLAKHRQSQIVQCKDADQFFASVEEKVQALEDLAAPHPLSAKIAVATVKRYLVDTSAKIRLHDLMHEETEKVKINLSGPRFEPHSKGDPKEALSRQIKEYNSLLDVILSLVITGTYWGMTEQKRLWLTAIQRISERDSSSGEDHLVRLKYYPALLLMYGCGIAAIASDNLDVLYGALTQVKVGGKYSLEKALCSVVYPIAVIRKETGQMLTGMESRHTPANDLLHEVLRDYFREYLPSDEDYDRVFDRFEYYLGLIHADLNQKTRVGDERIWGPIGRFSWREEDEDTDKKLATITDREIGAVGGDWPLVKAGLFGGDIDRARSSKAGYDALLAGMNWY